MSGITTLALARRVGDVKIIELLRKHAIPSSPVPPTSVIDKSASIPNPPLNLTDALYIKSKRVFNTGKNNIFCLLLCRQSLLMFPPIEFFQKFLGLYKKLWIILVQAVFYGYLEVVEDATEKINQCFSTFKAEHPEVEKTLGEMQLNGIKIMDCCCDNLQLNFEDKVFFHAIIIIIMNSSF